MGKPVTHTAVILLSTGECCDLPERTNAWSTAGAWLAVGVRGHIGEPCNSLLKMCLPPSPNIYCDQSNICRCKPDYPVEIQPHTCKAAKRIGQR